MHPSGGVCFRQVSVVEIPLPGHRRQKHERVDPVADRNRSMPAKTRKLDSGLRHQDGAHTTVRLAEGVQRWPGMTGDLFWPHLLL